MIIKRWHKTRGVYVYDIRLINERGKKQLFSTGLTKITAARRAEEKLRNEIAEKRMFPDRIKKNTLIREFIPKYIEGHVLRLARKRDYISILRKIEKEFGHIPLGQIDNYLVDRYMSRRYAESSVYMANREITVLQGMLTKAVEWKFIPNHPLKKIKKEKELARSRVLSDSELSRLIDAAQKNKRVPYLAPAIKLAVLTGLRKDELLQLTTKNIDLEKRILRIIGKGNKERTMPLSTHALKIITQLMDGRSQRPCSSVKKYVITGRQGKKLNDLKKPFARAIKEAKLENVRFHDLRRTFGTKCAIKGVPPKILQKWMGHANITTTMKYYVNIPEKYEQEAIERIQYDTKEDSREDT
jgi:integrase